MAEPRSKEGHSLIPTLIPPETDFPYPHVPTASTAKASTSARRNTTSAATSTTAVSEQSPANGQVPSHPEPYSLPLKNVKRATTQPEIGVRPVLPPKSGIERAGPTGPSPGIGLRRSRTSGPNTKLQDFPYQFDDDSGSSSSSSDEEWATNKKKKERPVGQTSDQTMEALSGWRHEDNYRFWNRKRRREPSNGPYSRFSILNDYLKSKGRVNKKDGRLNISVSKTANSEYLAKALGASIKHHLLRAPKKGKAQLPDEEYSAAIEEIIEDDRMRPRLNIVIIVIGSRGDIQPFLKIGKILKNDYGHRVRIATHPAFKDFIEKDSNLEFFSVGGDPSELMAFMVKNPGLIPSMDTVRAGEIGKRRASMYEMFHGMWRACINATDDETDKANMKMMGEKHPFVADAIIANPPSFAHVHIAERLGIPLHMMFTFPYTPTTQFPHPLANIKNSNVDPSYTNFMSYPLVELMTWQGLGDLVNKFRTKSLGLEPVSTLWAPGQLYRFKVPYTYLWSPSLVPKPPDWGAEIDIVGFVFLEMASSFEPPEDLVKFLDAGEPPVYIGFGSIVVDDPDSFTKMIFEAVKLAGVRALVSKGWGGLGRDEMGVPDNIFMLDNTPHDWLFPKCSAVVHHGGAGTTAIGLKCGKPSMIVPFFGDQPFWGSMVADARAGAFKCIPYKKLSAEKLAEGIKQCLTEEANENVKKIADSISKEGDGALNAVKSFHRSLPLTGNRSLRCSILENRVAVWQLKNTSLRLSALAAEILVEKKRIKWADLRLIRHYEWNDFDGPGEPFTGGGTAVYRTVADVGKGVGLVPVRATRTIKKRIHHSQKKKKWKERTKRQELQQKHEACAEAIGEGTNPATEADCTQPENHQPAAEPETSSGDEKETPEQADVRPSGPEREDTDLSALSADPSENVLEELAEETGASLHKTGAALINGPMDFALAVAQGFHNAPRLYGDDTVRVPRRINGLHSGLKAGRDEFIYGISDAFTGLVRLPKRGYNEDGVIGCMEGFGMGIGGLVLKNIAAALAPGAYAAKGVQKEIQKKRSPTGFIRRARRVQGGKEIRILRDAESISKTGWTTPADVSLDETSNQRNDKLTDKQQQQQPIDDTIALPRSSTEHQRAFNTESLTSLEAKVDQGWQIVLDVLDAAQKRKHQGFLGRIVVKREAKKWRESQALESVNTAKRALEAKKEGKDVGEELKRQKLEVKGTKRRGRRTGMEGKSKLEGGGGETRGSVDAGWEKMENMSLENGGLTQDGRPRGNTEGANKTFGGAKLGARRSKSHTEVADFAVAGRPA